VQDVRNRELRVFPLYPKTEPFIKLDGFIFSRDAASEGGDFVAYIKDVRVLYDEAVLPSGQDIDDESVWGIVGKKEAERKQLETSRFGYESVLRSIERLKQETKTDFTDTSATK
jgi:hypothetical protein